MNRQRFGISLGLLLLLPLIARAAPVAPGEVPPLRLPASLDLSEALRLFRQHGLDLLLADAAVAQSRAMVTAAGMVPNPLLSGGFNKAFGYDPNDPTTCPPGSGCSDIGGQITLADQALWDVLSGKRGLRLAVARAGLRAAQFERQDVERQLLFQVKQQLLQTALLQRLVEFSQEVVAAAEKTAELGQQRFSAGAISEVDLTKAETEHLMAQQTLDGVRRELRLRQLELAFSLGARGPVPDFKVRFELSGAVSSELQTDEAARAQAIELALAHRPDLQAQEAMKARARALLDAAHRQRLPDVTLSVQYQQQGRGQTAIQPPTLTVGAGLLLPLFNQAQGAIEKGRAEVVEQSLQYQKRQAQVVADVESSYATLELNRRLIERLERELLGRAQLARDLCRLRYEKGAASLLEYLDAQRVYIATHRDYFAALAGYFTARFGLERALGM